MKKVISLILSVLFAISIVTSTPVISLGAGLAKPTLTSATNLTAGIKVKWKKVSNATSYRVYRKLSTAKNWTYINNVKTTSYIDKNVVGGKTYRYTVKAVKGKTLSSHNTTGVGVKRLTTPQNIKAKNQTFSVKVTWNKVTGANGYRVYRRLNTENKWTFIKAVTKTTYTDQNVKENKSYRYTIRAAYNKTYSDCNANGTLIKYVPAYKVNLNKIPKFSSKPYVVINNNTPGLKLSQRTSKYFERYSKLDKYGRCGVAFACLGKETMPTEERGSIGSVKPSGWKTVKYDCVDGKYLYNRCHLIGFQLSAENANKQNLITGTRFLNVNGMLPFENMVADYIKETGNHVLYRVTPIFKGTELVARGVQIEAYSVEDKGEGICFNVYCYNNQPGISINYKNGNSSLVGSSSGTTTKPSTNTTTKPSADTDYILNTSSKKFHYPDCGSAKRISAENKAEFSGTRKELINMGYSPCGNCDP